MPTRSQLGSPGYTISFYRSQLRKFEKLGIGKRTEFDVMVTQKLIDTTKKRLDQLVINRGKVL